MLTALLERKLWCFHYFLSVLFSAVLSQAVCDCGYVLDVSGKAADADLRCPRCGRRIIRDDVALDGAALDEWIDEDPKYEGRPHLERTTNESHESQASSQFRDTSRFISEPVDDPEITLEGSNISTDALSADAAANDFEIEPPSSRYLKVAPDSASSSVLQVSKYDLTQRIMRPISTPMVPTIPYAGPGEYDIHRILRVHQRGGMGRILVAYDQYLKREVAIKELHQDIAEDEGIVRRFIGEAEITAQLEHPGVVPIHRLVQGNDGLPYYTMKMVRGETLQEAIKAYHRSPEKQELLNLVRRLVSVSKTMAFAHSKGVIHRDLKPANVMLGEHGETLVMDWGLAKPYGQAVDEAYVSIIHRTKQPRPELTMVGSIVGTPAFMSPEQANAEDKVVGPLSDVFSLGTVLYYLLAGQTAFAGRSTQDVLSKVRACNPIPPSQIKPNVPPDLETICLKAMEKLPKNRYQGASEFAEDLCRWLDNEPILAGENTFLSKIRRRLLRYRISFFGIISVLLLSLLFSGIGVWMLERARSAAEKDAEKDTSAGHSVFHHYCIGNVDTVNG